MNNQEVYSMQIIKKDTLYQLINLINRVYYKNWTYSINHLNLNSARFQLDYFKDTLQSVYLYKMVAQWRREIRSVKGSCLHRQQLQSRNYFHKWPHFFHTCAMCFGQPSCISTMGRMPFHGHKYLRHEVLFYTHSRNEKN